MPFAVIYRSRGGTYTEGVYYLSAGLMVIAGVFLRLFMRMVDNRLRELGFESEFNNTQAADAVHAVASTAKNDERRETSAAVVPVEACPALEGEARI